MKITIHKTTTIHYRVIGNGNPLVFLHGFLEDSSMWNEFIKSFIPNHKIILIDLPCHGLTRFDGNECSMQFMAECVQVVLEKENITNPKLFGHSMGGYVGLELSKLIPLNLTLIHSNFWADGAEKQNDRSRVIKIVNLKKEFFIKEAIPNLFYSNNRISCDKSIQILIEKANTIPAKEICAAIMGLKNRHTNYDLMNTQKINFIQGDFDSVMTTEKLKIELKNLTTPQNIYYIKDCGHMSIWEKEKELLKIIIDIV